VIHIHRFPLSLTFKVKVEVEVKLRPTVSWPVRLGVRHSSVTRDQFFFLLEIFFRQLRVCNLLLLLVLASAVPLGSEQRGTQDRILLSKFLRLPQPGGPGPRIYSPQEQGGPVIPPDTGFPFRRSCSHSIYGFLMVLSVTDGYFCKQH
jgi:hypothetical protein